MSETSIKHAQADMRTAYFSGAAGVLVSGCVWLTAGVVASLNSASTSVLVLLARGALEGTFGLLAGIAIAYGMHVLRVEWFFPAMLLVIGGRYLTFQSLYGLRIYWLLGASLCLAGIALALLRAPTAVSALSGAAIELAIGAYLLAQVRRGTA